MGTTRRRTAAAGKSAVGRGSQRSTQSARSATPPRRGTNKATLRTAAGRQGKKASAAGRASTKAASRATTAASRAPKVASKAAKKTFFVHPKGMADSKAIGPRTRVWAFAHVMRGARLGADCNIGECAFIEDGVVLGDHVTVKNGVQVWTGVTCEDYVFVGPNATFTNDLRPRVANPVDPAAYARTHVCYGASIGANATIVAGTTVGHHAMIGAGTVVIRDVPDHALVVGNPARRVGWACACGARLDGGLVCPSCGARYRHGEKGLERAGTTA